MNEYAWPSDGCGQPCATEPVTIAELLSLGGDVFELSVPKEERQPKPPELTKEEAAAFKEATKELKPKERKAKEKQAKEDRKTVAARQALVARHKYVVSRLHYRYDDKSLPNDPEFGVASGAVEGGVAQPKGPKGEASLDVAPASQNKFQVRYNNFHPWVPVIQCQNPERYRWGKAPRDYRGLRKTWIAEDLTRKSRTQIKPAAVVKTPIPSLGLTGAAPAASAATADAGADAGTGGAPRPTGKCGCSVPGAPGSAPALSILSALTGLALLYRRAPLVPEIDCAAGVARRRRQFAAGVCRPRLGWAWPPLLRVASDHSRQRRGWLLGRGAGELAAITGAVWGSRQRTRKLPSRGSKTGDRS